MFSEEEGRKVVDPVTLAEIQSTLKGFSASKIPGSDGWTVEFFLAFFDLVGNDILDMVEETRRKGRVSGALNATFLALIPKSEKPTLLGGLDLLPYAIWSIRSLLRLLLLELKPVCL
jgi:hypothetical protein